MSKETKSENNLTLTQQAQMIVLPNGTKMSVARQITLPLLKHKDGETVYITVVSEIYSGKQIKPKEGDQQQKPADLVKIIDLQSGLPHVFIVPAVLKDAFIMDYDESNTYVGKSFAIMKMPREEGKRHKNLQIVELVVE